MVDPKFIKAFKEVREVLKANGMKLVQSEFKTVYLQELETGKIIPLKRIKNTVDSVEDQIDAWHKSKQDIPIHEFLNWTEEEYLHYVMTGEAPKEENK